MQIATLVFLHMLTNEERQRDISHDEMLLFDNILN